jgi:predicted nuclease with TOPRIM domain
MQTATDAGWIASLEQKLAEIRADREACYAENLRLQEDRDHLRDRIDTLEKHIANMESDEDFWELSRLKTPIEKAVAAECELVGVRGRSDMVKLPGRKVTVEVDGPVVECEAEKDGLPVMFSAQIVGLLVRAE